MPPLSNEEQEFISDVIGQDGPLQSTPAGKVADFRSLPSPVPLIRLYRTLNRLAAGTELTVLTTERGTLEEFQAFARMTGHALLEQRESDDGYVHVFRRR
ncbi:sulfurtransferase TusA family protein [Ramlibacter sp. MMS24-I3-19]|uniref:sulfurtransferase TusA family protein n=1 Tax=Ramlibacter sp. MMS24-I3-19 TaxID=3416606 RepID=UPI003CFD3BC4